MKHILLAAALLLPGVARAEHTIIPGMSADLPSLDGLHVKESCQFVILPGFVTPGVIEVTDVVTKEVLLYIPAGGSVSGRLCINASDGHAVDVLTPAPGAEYKRVGAQP